MPRINLDEQLFSDERFLYVSRKIGRYEAMGQLIFLIKTAQRYWSENEQKIPENVFKLGEYSDEFFNSGLLTKEEDGIYLAGSREYFAWIIASKKNGKKGGRPRKINDLKNPDKTQDNPDITQKNHINIINNINKKENIKRKVDPLNLTDAWNKFFPDKKNLSFGISGKHLQNFLNSNEFLKDSIKNWEDVFSKVRESDFLRENKRISFNWILDYDNIQNVMQGKYDNCQKESKQEKIDLILKNIRNYNPTDHKNSFKLIADEIGDLVKIFEKVSIGSIASMTEFNAKKELTKILTGFD